MQLACSWLPPLLRLHALFFYAQNTIKGEVSQSHEGLPPFWSGNRVGVRPCTAASFGLPVPTQREDTRRCKAPLLTARSYTVKGGLCGLPKKRIELACSGPTRKGSSRYPFCPTLLRGPG